MPRPPGACSDRTRPGYARDAGVDWPQAASYRSVKSILQCGLDRQESALLGGGAAATASPMPAHVNVRGPGYYGHH